MSFTDDIQEAYRRLRRLVTDYLGISLVSEQSDSADEEETLLVTEGQQTQMGTRTWSKPSIPDSLSQPYTRGKTCSPVQSGRGILVGYKSIIADNFMKTFSSLFQNFNYTIFITLKTK